MTTFSHQTKRQAKSTTHAVVQKGSTSFLAGIISLLALTQTTLTPALAANLYWDANGITAGAGGATPSGTWGTDNFWSTSSAGTAATATWTSGETAVFSAGTDAAGTFAVNISGTQTAAGLLVEEGNLTLGGGDISLSAGASLSVAASRSLTISSSISGTSLTKSGGGLLTLSGVNTFTGPLTLSGSSTRFNDNGAAGFGSIVISGSGVNLQSSVSGVTLTNPVVVNASVDISAQAGSLTLNGQISGAQSLWSVGGQAANTIVFGGNNVYSGNAEVNGGTLIVTRDNALGTVGGTTKVFAGATLGLQGGFDYNSAEVIKLNGNGVGGAGAIQNISGINQFFGPIDLQTSVTIGGASGSLDLGGTISGGAFNITKVGNGRIIISGLGNTFAATAVNAGILEVKSTLGSGTVTVSAGATLAGEGDVPGAVILSGEISPASSPGAITTGSQTWNTDASYLWEINQADFGIAGDSSGWDLVDIAGSLTINATTVNPFTIKLSTLDPFFDLPGDAGDFDETADYDFPIAITTGGVSGFSADKFIINTSAFSNYTGLGTFVLELANANNDLVLKFVHPAFITSQPSSATNQCGVDNASFTVGAGGTGSLTYQWLSNGVPVVNGGRIAGATSSTLTISPVHLTDSANYSCSITNIYGATNSTIAVLTVVDTIAPALACPATVNAVADLGVCVATGVLLGTPGVVEACDVSPVITNNSALFSLGYPVGTNTVTWGATDGEGNHSECQQLVIVADTQNPIVVTSPISRPLDVNGDYTLTASDIATILAGSSDNCGIAATNLSQTNFNYCYLGANNVTVTLTDIHNNSANAIVVVTLTAPPTPTVVYVDDDYPATCAAVNFPSNGVAGPYYVGFNAFNTIQAGIDAVATGGTVNVAAGTYSERVTVNKANVSVQGGGITSVVTGTTTAPGGATPTVFKVTATGVTINNFKISVDFAFNHSGVHSSGDCTGMTVSSNTIVASASAAPAFSYGLRNAIGINPSIAVSGYTQVPIGFSGVTAAGNTIQPTGLTVFFRAGIQMDYCGGSIVGNTSATINHDFVTRFANQGDIFVGGNSFYGGGAQFGSFNSGAGTITITNNLFDNSIMQPASGAIGTGASLRLIYFAEVGSVNNNVIVSGNTFQNHRWAASVENFKNVTFHNNAFTPKVGATDYVHVTFNTKIIASTSALVSLNMFPVGATLTANTFNGSGAPGGTALAFYNHRSTDAVFGTYTIGTLGNENNFMAGIDQFIQLDSSTGLSSAWVGFGGYGATPVTTMAPWSSNLDAQNNRFDVGAGLTLPPAMTLAQLFATEDRIDHATDTAGLGFVRVEAANVYVTASSGSIQRGINPATPGDTVNVNDGTYTESLNVNKALLVKSASGFGVTTIGGTAQTAVTISADDVTLVGFTVTNPGGKWGIYSPNRNNIVLAENRLTDIGNSDATPSGSNVGIAIESSSAAVNNVQIVNNVISNLFGGNFKTAQAIVAGFSGGLFDITGLVIQSNRISQVTSSTNAFGSGGRGAYGVILNHTTASAGKTVGAVIKENEITDLIGLWAHGIGLEGNTPGAVVQSNLIARLTDYKSPLVPDAVGVMVEQNASASSVNISFNSFRDMMLGIRNVTAFPVTAESNWWASASGPAAVSNPGGAGVAASALVDFSPWLGDGSDNAGWVGFQPNLAPIYFAPKYLAFSTQPGDAGINSPFPPQPAVQVIDENNTLATTFNGSVTVAINTGTPGAILSGGLLTVPVSSGVASFSGLQIDLAGTYTLSAASASPIIGTNSAPFNVANALPSISTLSPPWAVAGDPGFTLTVNGANFVYDSVVRWGGSDRSTTFVSSSQLTASISAADITSVGFVNVTVFNDPPGGGESISVSFEVKAVPTVVYVDDDYTSGSSGGHIWGYDAFDNVQSGINRVAPNGTVHVAAGSYAQNVLANKPVTLLGANLGVAGCGVRGPESAIAGGAGIAVDVQSDGVTVDGFALTGAYGLRDVGYELVVVRHNAITAAAVGVDLEGIAPTAVAGVTVSNNCVTLTSQLAGPNPTVGVLVAGVSGTTSPVIDNNNVSAGWFGYLLYDASASVNTVVKGGTVTGVRQGLAVLNYAPPTFPALKPSSFTADGIGMSGFTGATTHAGVYVFTGGADPLAVVTGTIKNLNVTGTGKPVQDSAGIVLADFSTAVGTRQNISVEVCTITNNLNRGISVRGSNCVASVTSSVVENNGSDPFGLGGNDGFGIVARESSSLFVMESSVANPASVAGGYSVTALAAHTGAQVLAISNSVVNGVWATARLAHNDGGSSQLNASGNWLGSTSETTIAGLVLGSVDFTPYLDSGVDLSPGTSGFQGDFATLHVTTLGSQIGVVTRIQEGVDMVSGSTVLVEAGAYAENVVINKKVVVDGTGSGSGAGDSIVTAANPSLPVFLVTDAGGLSAGDRLTIKDIRVTGGSDGVQVNAGTGTRQWYRFDNVSAANNSSAGIALTGVATLGEVEVANSVLSNNGIYGLQVAPTLTSFASLAVSSSSVDNNGNRGLAVDGTDANATSPTGISVTGTSFNGNGTSSVAGDGDVSFFLFNGDASLTNVTVTADAQFPIQLRGKGTASPGTWAALGTVRLENVTVTGATTRPGLYIVRFSNVANVSFENVNVSGLVPPVIPSGFASVMQVQHTGVTPLNLHGLTLQATYVGGPPAGYGSLAMLASGGAIADCTTVIVGATTAQELEGSVYDQQDNAAVGDVVFPTLLLTPVVSSVIAECTGSAQATVTFTSPTVTADCTPTGAVVCTPASGSIFALGTNIVSCTVTDNRGISNSTNFTVVVLDTTRPGIVSCAPNTNVVADAFCNGITPNLTGMVVANDGCGSGALVVTQNPLVGSSIPLGPNLVTLTITDPSGNFTNCVATVTVVDVAAPIVTFWPTNRTLNVGGLCNVAVPDLTGEVVATDNCTPLLTVTQNPLAGTLVSLGATTVTVTVADQAANFTNYNTILTIVDTNPAPLATYVDDGYVGLLSGTVVTWPYSGGSGTHYIGCDAFPTIQGGIDRVAASGSVNVAAGTYNEDVNINKAVSVLGAGAGISVVVGPIGGAGSTFQFASSGSVLDGFTITRAGNNLVDWNNPGLNSAGVAMQGLTVDGTVRNCLITGMRTAIDINNSGNSYILNNVITNNRTGLIMRNQTDNLVVTGNAINDNWTVGVLFLDASGGSNIPVQTAANCSFTSNSIAGNWYGQIVDRQTGGSLPASGANLKNFSGNWLGTAAPAVVVANSTEPGYSAQIPVIFGGTAVPPGGQPDIAGLASANIDYTPWLDVGTDTSVAFGFQGDFATLHVDDNSPQVGAVTRIQEGVDMVSGSTVLVEAGAYAENVVINKKVVVDGTGSGAGAGDSIVTAANPALPVFLVTDAGGTGAGDRLTIKDLRVTGGSDGIQVNAATGVRQWYRVENVAGVNNSSAGVALTGVATLGEVEVAGSVLSNNGVYGLQVADTLAAFAALAVSGGSMDNNGNRGLAVDGTDANATSPTLISVTGTSLNGNGSSAIAGDGDVSFYLFNGDAALTNVTVTADSQFPIQFRGKGTASPGSWSALGTVRLEGVTVSGATTRPGLYIIRYTNVANVSFENVNLSGLVPPVIPSGFASLMQVEHTGATPLNLHGLTLAATYVGGPPVGYGALAMLQSGGAIADCTTVIMGATTVQQLEGSVYDQQDQPLVGDVIFPTLALTPVVSSVIAECTGGGSATVTFASPSVTADCPPTGAVVCTPASGSIFALGTNIVSCTVTDNRGISNSTNFTVVVLDTVPPTMTAGSIATCYETSMLAEAAALSATTVSDTCVTPNVAAVTSGTCSATVTVYAWDSSGNTNSVVYNTRIDPTAPIIGLITATEVQLSLPVNVKNNDCLTNPVIQGTVQIVVVASDNCSLVGGSPSVTLVNGTNIETATFVSQSGDTNTYTWVVTSATANGTWTATVAASDICHNTTTNFTMCVNKSQVTGLVQLEGFIGTGTNVNHSRLVTFVATGGITNKTWNLTLTNVSGDTFNYTLTDVPAGTTGISAKTDWNLREKLAVALDINGQATADFIGNPLDGWLDAVDHYLRGCDISAINPALRDNSVQFFDYSVLGSNFFTFNSVADVTGDGQVDYDDYLILYLNYFTAGDAP